MLAFKSGHRVKNFFRSTANGHRMIQYSTHRPGLLKLAFNAFRSASSGMTKKTALILLSEGSEEAETVITTDVLRRAGIEVTVAGVQGNKALECSRQVKILPDMSFEDATSKGKYDVVVLPGGLKGANEFCENKKVGKLLKEQEQSGGTVAAICAAPTALKAHQVFLGKKLTSYPAMQNQLVENQLYVYLNDKVVVDGNLITSRGPATAFDFALAIAEKLVGKETADSVAKQLLLI